MNVLIVYAHPEPKSFNGALRDVAGNLSPKRTDYGDAQTPQYSGADSSSFPNFNRLSCRKNRKRKSLPTLKSPYQ